MKFFLSLFLGGVLSQTCWAQLIELPPRSALAISGERFVQEIEALDLQQREEKILREFLSGNVPEFLRKLVPVSVTNSSASETNIATFYTTPDYLAIGSDDDYFLAALTPFTAQKIADAVNCSLPTRKMVNAIYANAVVKLAPSTIPPGADMVTVSTFQKHNEAIRKARFTGPSPAPLGALVAGHKKDVIISSRLASISGKVAIYGWHQTNGIPIQPLYFGHADSWVDYSHGIRLVHNQVVINGQSKNMEDVLAHSSLARLLSDEEVIARARYRFEKLLEVAAFATPAPPPTSDVESGQFQKSPGFDEQTMLLRFDRGVRVVINAPSAEKLAARKQMKLIFYALPNGNTIEQTVGKQTTPEDDWHFNIQHIGAQTRFLRQKLTNENIVVVYLENDLKTWPAWRKKFGDQAVKEIMEKILARFEAFEPGIILSGHSGGGSFTFAYLNCVEKIPDEIERIAFLDSNYGYETALHGEKLAQWLQASHHHFLAVLAYHDNIALLNGKPFVTAAGGTWGRSHLMKRDLETIFPFMEEISPGMKIYSALKGRIKFFFKDNPEKKILHTVQVEKNGFIHAMLTGAALENRDYNYFGDRAYTRWVSPMPTK